MESVGKISGGRVPAGQIVEFLVSPGFKLGNGSVVKVGFTYLADMDYYLGPLLSSCFSFLSAVLLSPLPCFAFSGRLIGVRV
ncbi:hypothetical protein V6N12_052473 [Hibiscus sabdariffa]|uniref:Uncharacterized protein n=1 Tax=Hibiscus sabdariffa TaxID=183260 RepID=A0ABR2C1S1_9ROSI